MKKLLLFLTLLVFTSGQAIAQNATIKGTIKTSDGRPAQFVYVALKGTTKGTATNASGDFELKKIESGTYTLVVSLLGMESLEQPVSVQPNETVTLPEITLNVSNQDLNEVAIEARRNNRESAYVAKMPLKNLENPQVYHSIDSRLLKEQVVTNFDDALKNAPGVEKLWESTGRGGDGGGYYSLRGFSVQPTLVNGLPGLTNGSLDPANIERIEVLKGPSGTLFGSSLISYGGLINTVTKKPFSQFGGEISYVTGSYGLNRIAADVNTPLSKENDISFRLNAAYHTENSFQDAGFRKALLIAPSLAYRVNNRLSFLVLSEFLSAESTNATMLFLNRTKKLTAPDLETLGYDNKRSYTSNNLSLKTPSSNLQAQMHYKLSGSWLSQTVISSGSSHSNGYYAYLYENGKNLPIAGSVFDRFVSRQNANTTTTDIQQNFIGSFELAPNVTNKMVAGLDYYQNTSVNNSTGYVANGKVYIGKADQKMVYDSVFAGNATPSYDSGKLSGAAMDAILAGSSVSNIKTQFATYSAYVSDVISFDRIGLSAMASLRVDHFDTKGNITSEKVDYRQTALSPKFGLVYQPLKDKVSVFANYQNGFKNVAPIDVADADGTNIRTKTFRPEQATQTEFGIKTNLLDNRLTSSVSYYNILVGNKVMSDPENINNSIQGGEVESKGFEIDVVASPVKGFDILLGYAHNDNKVLKATAGDVFSQVGRRTLESGPEDLFNAWATYRISGGSLLNGLGFGFGANAASERLIIDSEGAGTFALPAYTIFNGSVFYQTQGFRFTFKADNLTNKEYYKGWTTINPQRPRSVSASFTYLF